MDLSGALAVLPNPSSFHLRACEPVTVALLFTAARWRAKLTEFFRCMENAPEGTYQSATAVAPMNEIQTLVAVGVRQEEIIARLARAVRDRDLDRVFDTAAELIGGTNL